MYDDPNFRLSETASSLRNLGMDQRKVSPKMQAAIDRGKAALQSTSTKVDGEKRKHGGVKFKPRSLARQAS